VVKKLPLKNSAFTLIELIFAIVVIALSVMSLPMMKQIVSSGMEKNLAQEAIFTAISEMNLATTYAWDESSLLDSNVTGNVDKLSRVVNTNNECNNSGRLDDASVPIMSRVGHINRRCLNDLTIPLYPANTNSCPDCNLSLNTVVHGNRSTFEVGGGTSVSGYKIAYKSKLDVERCDGNCVDFGDPNNINMKEITVTIQNDKNETITILRTYSANIGEVSYHRRSL
jgi:prepilin-type N-terminal cleavage/methylation domain-containing protein